MDKHTHIFLWKYRVRVTFALCAWLILHAVTWKALAVEQQDTDRFGTIDWSEPARLATHSLLLDISVFGDRIVVVVERGHILVSEDKGGTWRQARVPTRSMLTGVSMINGTHIWAVGHDAIIVHSADAGETWHRQFYAPDLESPLLDVWFENVSHGISVGAYGLFLETFDGGTTWHKRVVDEEERHGNALACARDGALFAAAEGGVVCRSRDKGRTWDFIQTPYSGSFFGVVPLSDMSILTFGLRGNVYKSKDSGDTWNQVPTPTTTSLLGGCQSENGDIFLVGLSGTILISRNNAETFEAMNRPDRKGIAAVAHVGPQGVLLAGEAGIHWANQGK